MAGGLNTYIYVGGNPVNLIDIDGNLPSLPQGLVDSVTGFGDGVAKGITFGLLSLGDVRDLAGIDGGVDQCSRLFTSFESTGKIAGGLALAGTGGKILLDIAKSGSNRARVLAIIIRLAGRASDDVPSSGGTGPRLPQRSKNGGPDITNTKR